MMRLKKLLLFLFLIMPISLYSEESSVKITLINNSSQKFVFDRSFTNGNNKLQVSSNILNPGQEIIITGIINGDFDLLGILYFSNNKAQFIIKNNRQFKYGQPIFNMHANKILSNIKSKTMNPVKGPKLLSYSAVTVILSER